MIDEDDAVCWGNRVSHAFVTRVLEIGDEFRWSLQQVSYLMACMAFETAETFSASIKNSAGSGATGLIQFMPITARGLGTTTAELAEMSEVEQLDFVEAYFRPYYKRTKTLSDLYMAILYPKFIGRKDNDTLFNQETITYRQNRGLDVNRDGRITKGEVSRIVQSKLDKGYLEGNVLLLTDM